MDEKEIKILIFIINNQYYATDISQVQRILGYSISTHLPDSPSFVEGVIDYEGGVLPVINLAKKFKVPSKDVEEETKIIVAKEEEYQMGIIVDVVSEVCNVKLKNIEETPEIVAGISRRYIKGLIKLNGKIIIFLDFATIFTEEEKESILK